MEKGCESGTSPAAYPTWDIRSKKETSLSFHRPPLSGGQVVLRHRRSREMVLMHKRKQVSITSRSSTKACKSSMRGLPKTSSAMSYQLDGPGPPAGSSHRWSRFRQPSGSHGVAHP